MNTNQWKLAEHIIGRNLFLTKGHLQTVKGAIRTLRGIDPRCVLRCDNQALLGYYVKIISKLLTTVHQGVGDDGVSIEIVEGSSGDAFLDAINSQIDDIKLEQAVSLTDASAPRRFLIVNKAENLGSENEQALRYLLRDFPAINLACLYTTTLPAAEAVTMLQPAPAHYQLDIPGEETIAQIRRAARNSRNGSSIAKLLDRIFGSDIEFQRG